MVASWSPHQPLLVTGSVREFELQPADGMLPGAPPVTVTSTAEPVAPPAAPQGELAQLQISVATGCQAGQTLQFTPPGYVQPLSVVMQQQVAPGSIVTVQYPMQGSAPTVGPNTGLPGVAQQGHMMQPGALPPMQFNVAEEDSRGQNVGWILYIVGCVCLLFLPICGPALWMVAAGMYYCKPPVQRAQLPRSRVPALTALITCIACCGCFTIFFFVWVAILMSCQTVDERTGKFTPESCGWLPSTSTPPPYHPHQYPTPWLSQYTTASPPDHAEDLLFTTPYDSTTDVSKASKMPPVAHAGFEVKETADTIHV